MKIKSQSAIEFIIVVGFMFFIFTAILMTIQISTSDKIKEDQTLRVKEIVIAVQDEINLAFESQDGYQREFKIPENINGIEYNIQVVVGLVYLNTSDGKNAIALPVKDINGDVVKGTNLIKKEDGVIKLNV